MEEFGVGPGIRGAEESHIIVILHCEIMKASTGFGWPIVTTLGHLSLPALLGNGSFGRGAECQNLGEWSFLEPDTIKRSDSATYKFNSLYYGQIHF